MFRVMVSCEGLVPGASADALATWRKICNLARGIRSSIAVGTEETPILVADNDDDDDGEPRLTSSQRPLSKARYAGVPGTNCIGRGH